jgi:hypothetical protein
MCRQSTAPDEKLLAFGVLRGLPASSLRSWYGGQ